MPKSNRLAKAYLAVSGFCLVFALAVVAWEPWAVLGFFYHPRILAVVHLVTLGWITGSLLGLLHWMGPRLGVPLPAGWWGWSNLCLYVLGASGVMSHFFIGEISGVGSSGFLAAVVLLRFAMRFLVGLWSSARPAAEKIGFGFAFGNLLLAAILGISIVVDRYFDVLPGFVLQHVFAHGYLASIGWAALMVFLLAENLWPPAYLTTSPRWNVLRLIVFEAGVLGSVIALLVGKGVGLAAVFLCVILVLWAVALLRQGPETGEGALQSNGEGRVFFRQSLIFLLLTAFVGLALVVSSNDAWRLSGAFLEGIFGLLGFLATAILGLVLTLVGEGRPSRPRWVAPLWGVGIVLLALGFYGSSALMLWISVGMLLLALGGVFASVLAVSECG